MARTTTFFASAACALAAFWMLATAVPASLRFEVGPAGRASLDAREAPEAPMYLDRIPAEAMTAMKLAAVDGSPGLGIGLFGNSRSIMVGREHLGLEDCTFFNYSVAGTSLRSSVAMLEMLTANGRAPRVALVSLDHIEIGMMGHPEFLPLGQTLQLMWGDLLAAGASAELPRIAWRHGYGLWQKAKRVFSSDAAAYVLLEVSGGTPSAGARYRDDGSREERATGGSQVFAFTPAPPKEILDGLVVRDLERFSHLRDAPGGPKRLILYESSLAPPFAAQYRERPTPAARAHREAVARGCEAFGLTCVLGGLELAGAAASDVVWPDATHAPASLLGAALREVIASNGGCGGGAE